MLFNDRHSRYHWFPMLINKTQLQNRKYGNDCWHFSLFAKAHLVVVSQTSLQMTVVVYPCCINIFLNQVRTQYLVFTLQLEFVRSIYHNVPLGVQNLLQNYKSYLSSNITFQRPLCMIQINTLWGNLYILTMGFLTTLKIIIYNVWVFELLVKEMH